MRRREGNHDLQAGGVLHLPCKKTINDGQSSSFPAPCSSLRPCQSTSSVFLAWFRDRLQVSSLIPRRTIACFGYAEVETHGQPAETLEEGTYLLQSSFPTTDAVQISVEQPPSGTSRESGVIGSRVTESHAHHLPVLANHNTERLYQNVPASRSFCLRTMSCRYHYCDC
jgi:hypothetical protein